MYIIYLLTATLIALADRLVKIYVVKNIGLGQSVPFLKGVLDLTHVENTGAAFSKLQGMRWLLVAVTVVAVIAIFVLIFTKKVRHPLEVWPLTLVAGGAVGNLIDRIATGRVIDMFQTTFVNFAIFNVADCFINIGGITLCVYLIFFAGRKNKQEEKSDGSDTSPHS